MLHFAPFPVFICERDYGGILLCKGGGQHDGPLKQKRPISHRPFFAILAGLDPGRPSRQPKQPKGTSASSRARPIRFSQIEMHSLIAMYSARMRPTGEDTVIETTPIWLSAGHNTANRRRTAGCGQIRLRLPAA